MWISSAVTKIRPNPAFLQERKKVACRCAFGFPHCDIVIVHFHTEIRHRQDRVELNFYGQRLINGSLNNADIGIGLEIRFEQSAYDVVFR